ncbi:hypothetical protein DFA_06493 [Cavenderia fasciculata]|uniref:Uncharacterized protein n=1 Tax=Cavenderia fasciculata TaxID=261658 RepID=F4PJ57_CACFS|nr:uncharacterized protein DFA_06493 [Cavenderia fasciculata]EGG24343.1 hypothetical protein DFA_06493 [Cavenderia fasciculata]|eukprot:XP_004362194.1 hypothetical protein DFA_06493 [Cavenderia fasciculata]
MTTSTTTTTTKTTTTTTTTTKDNQIDDRCYVVQLSKYIQSIIIDMVIRDYDSKYCNGFKYISSNKESYLMINKQPKKKQNNDATFKQMISYALVSKWWLKVVQQITSSNLVITKLKESKFSGLDTTAIEHLKWNLVCEPDIYEPKYKRSKIDFAKLPLLLPQLKTIDIIGKDLENKAILDIVRLINTFPHIQTNLKITSNYNSQAIQVEWPRNISFDGPLKPIVDFTIINGYENDLSMEHNYMYQMIEFLRPNTINMSLASDQYFGGDGHFDYEDLFEHLNTTATRHINIKNDYIELEHLKLLVSRDASFNFQSLKTCIITCPLETEIYQNNGNDDTCHCRDIFMGDTLEDWDEFCINLTNNTTLTTLCLEEPFHEHPRSTESFDNSQEESIACVERLSSSFTPIWKTNNTMNVLGLSFLPNIISPQFFDTLSQHNQSITTLMLTEGTLLQEYITPLSKLIMTNQTIKELDISWNYLKLIDELEQAFKQNKSIRVLNIAKNLFHLDLLDALLESDSIQYLLIDQTMAQHNHKHRYFKQSKSLIQCFTIPTNK